jgi:MtN3 and saliva related transmembrane protein
MEFAEIAGLAAGICTSAASIPQIITTIQKQKAEQVSPLMFTVLLAGNALWVYYGFAKSDLPIIATNIVSVILDIIMLLLRFRYKRSNGR